MLTAKGETGDKVKAFQTGVDDYITKPFGPLELLARVTAKIRRVALDAETHRRGILTAASLMVSGRAAADAAQRHHRAVAQRRQIRGRCRRLSAVQTGTSQRTRLDLKRGDDTDFQCEVPRRVRVRYILKAHSGK